MKLILGLPLCFLLLVACGKSDDDDNDSTAQREQPAPSDNGGSFTKRCRLADEIAGSNFEFTWSTRTVGDRLQFDTDHNRVRVASTANSSVSSAATYTVTKPEPGTVGSMGSIDYSGFSLSFPVIPQGTVQGESGSYLIGNLMRGSDELGTYLCSPSLADELTSPSSLSHRNRH